MDSSPTHSPSSTSIHTMTIDDICSQTARFIDSIRSTKLSATSDPILSPLLHNIANSLSLLNSAILTLSQRTDSTALIATQAKDSYAEIASRPAFQAPIPSPPVISPIDLVSAEEKERERSIVVTGLAESPSGDSVERADHDIRAIRSLLTQLKIETVPCSVYRMGSNKDNRPRLIKVVLPARRFVYDALRLTHTLHTSDNFKGVYVRKSLTQAQRDEQAKMRDFLRALKKQDSACPFVLYKDQIWHREEIKGRSRKTFPPSMPSFTAPSPSGNA